MSQKIKIKVIPKSSQNKIGERVGDYIKVYVTDAPEKGKANKSVIEIISNWLGVSKSRIKIVRGQYSQIKILEIL